MCFFTNLGQSLKKGIFSILNCTKNQIRALCVGGACLRLHTTHAHEFWYSNRYGQQCSASFITEALVLTTYVHFFTLPFQILIKKAPWNRKPFLETEIKNLEKLALLFDVIFHFQKNCLQKILLFLA